MKKRILIISLLAASTAFAAPEDINVADWDVNGDGLLSREEAAAIQYHAFATYDLNEDGDLRGREREGFEAHLAFRRSEHAVFATLGSPDANGDLLISAGEFETWTGRMFDRLDQSGDGALSPMELPTQAP